MNAPEHVARLWLESKGFFVMGPMRVGHNEIDLLAVKLGTDTTSVEKKVHLELTVSGRPGGPDDGSGLAEYIAKFEGRKGNVSSKARAVLGDNYEKWVIVGKLVGGREKKWVDEAQTHGVHVFTFAQVVSEYLQDPKSTPADEIGRLLDTLSQLTLLATVPE